MSIDIFRDWSHFISSMSPRELEDLLRGTHVDMGLDSLKTISPQFFSIILLKIMEYYDMQMETDSYMALVRYFYKHHVITYIGSCCDPVMIRRDFRKNGEFSNLFLIRKVINGCEVYYPAQISLECMDKIQQQALRFILMDL